MRLVIIAFLVLFSVPFFALSQSQRVRVVDFQQSTCDKEQRPEMLRNRIIRQSFTKDTFVITIGVLGVCCIEFKPLVSFDSKKLNLDYAEYGQECDCKCYYELTYRITGLKNREFDVAFKNRKITVSDEKYNTYPIQFKMIGEDTVNLIDKFGMRQGIWTSDSTTIAKFVVYRNDVPIRDIKLFSNGNIFTEARKEYGNWNYFVEYYENGLKKKECYNDQPEEFYKDGKCREWDQTGQLIYEGPFQSRAKENN